ncbi:hypothetical protein [Caldisericum exile]|nr:hypothetical protein [Caldisericum exile]BAL81381.1 hypothetical protein CSE_12550 [Caldisericum exile AZM16c01]
MRNRELLNVQNLNKIYGIIRKFSSTLKLQELIDLRKEKIREELKHSLKLRKVIKVAFGIPIFGRSFIRDFSPLKTLLTDWARLPNRLVPVLGAGTMVSQIPPVGYMANLNWRIKNKPTKSYPISDSF